MKKAALIVSFGLLFFQYSCSQEAKKPQQTEVDITKYWTQGLAEINVYSLSQNRYKENHEGQLVSIFVREDFLYEKQVKNERYSNEKTTPIPTIISNTIPLPFFLHSGQDIAETILNE